MTEDKKKSTMTVDRLEVTQMIKGMRVLLYRLRPGTWAVNHRAGSCEILVTEESVIVSIVENYEKGDQDERKH